MKRYDKKIYYSDKEHPEEFMEKKKKEAPAEALLPAAQRFATDKKTNAAVPSDEAVEEMRRHSEERQL